MASCAPTRGYPSESEYERYHYQYEVEAIGRSDDTLVPRELIGPRSKQTLGFPPAGLSKTIQGSRYTNSGDGGEERNPVLCYEFFRKWPHLCKPKV